VIAYADQKAALAWLELLSDAVHGTDPNAILGLAQGATEFYAGLHPTRPDEFEAMGYALDAIAAAQYRGLCLLALADLGGDDAR
jgi:hypothetical protein